MRKKVAILGAGYAGIFAAANLCRAKTFDIILIDKNPYHLLLQQIPHIISGKKVPDDITFSLAELFRDEIAEGLLKILHGIIKGVELTTKTIRLESASAEEVMVEETLTYDYLIISLGAETNYFGVHGAEKHCLTFRSLQDALRIRDKVESLPANSTVLVGGAGASGVSLAAALSEMNSVKEKELKIRVVDSASNILPGWDVRLAVTSKNVLEAKRVQIIPGEKIKKVSSNFIETESGKQIESNCTIWTAGIKGYSNISITPVIERTNTGRIVVDRYSRIRGFGNAFAIGDISAIEIVDFNVGGDSNNTGPQLAQFAVRQARFVAVNIARKEKGDEMVDKLTFSQRGHTILLGDKSIGLLDELLVTGKMCEYAEDSIVDNFITEIRNKEKGISAKSLTASEKMKPSEQFPAAFNFVTYTTSEAFIDLIR